MSIADDIKTKIRKRAANDIIATKQMIAVKPTKGLFNYRCFLNAVEYGIENKCEVIEVVYIEDGIPVLHYINKTGKEYLETTIGHRADYIEYYFLRTIQKSEYRLIGWHFDNTLESLSAPYLNWFHKLIGIDRVF